MQILRNTYISSHLVTYLGDVITCPGPWCLFLAQADLVVNDLAQ